MAASDNKNTFKNENQKKTASPPKKTKKKPGKKKKAAQKQRFQNIKIITGIFLILFSFYLVISIISYIYQWFYFGNDDALLSMSFGEILTQPDIEHHNWAGRIGAALSYQFIHQWFGIGSLLFSFYFFVLGLFLSSGYQLVHLGKSLVYVVSLTIWISLTMGFLFFQSDELSVLSGVFGYQGNVMLTAILGNVGTGILLLFILLSITTVAYNIPLRWLNTDILTRKPSSAETPGEKPKRGKEKNIPKEKEPSHADSSTSSISKEKEGISNTEEYALDNEEENNTQQPNHQETTPEAEDKGAAEEETSGRGSNKSAEAKENEAEKDIESKNENGIEFTIETPKAAEEEDKRPSEPEHRGLDTEYDPTLDLRDFQFPPLDLLETYEDSHHIRVQKEELEENKQQIVDTLQNYSIKITSIRATPGPSVTLYEIVQAPGIRISKIKNLEDDIAMSLAAHGIRIIAPIPGRGTIGIEVPNKDPQTVSMRSILGSKKFTQSKYELPIGLGKTISNESYIADLAQMPHLLMAGATGQGKSVGLNAVITSLIYQKHPAGLKFILIDPKKVELTLYNKIERHYLAKLPDAEESIVTETREVVRTLNSLVIEMEDRYNLLKDAQVKSIKEYNQKFIARQLNPENGHRFLPYIVLVIDEFADLIMTSGKEVEGPITRLAQLARAIGIHLLIATQRPSVNIITGSIKANFPARIAYRVISKVDSRTILDSGGAEQLVGRGDMLLYTGKELVRLQGAYLDTSEIEKLTEYIGSQRAYPEAYKLPEYVDEEAETSKDLEDLGRDEMFEEAARVVVSNQHGSTSLLQRKLKIGYNRAGRIVDQLEAAGVVGPFEGSKAREVLIQDMTSLEQLLENLS
ncbi:MAG: DNA translocase FtsK 4TM domain-containing protein [Bacteroidales bacterium]|nr:DNA translocase FtsK 4TM domain-containing protein [Bacteroidales bacterium]MCF8338080.1 DNA translocase FtsK 4TM domain-containing protein [Bacteroidales bacterium]